MKHLISLLIILNISSCKKISSQTITDEQFIGENLKKVSNFPDEYFYPNGDSIYAKILSKGKKITPLLIEKITDTSASSVVYADVTRYRVGDIAIHLLDNFYNDEVFPIREMIEKEFHANSTNAENTLYIMCFDPYKTRVIF